MSAALDRWDPPADDLPGADLAERIALALRNRTGGVLTWLNHHSALQDIAAGVPLESFDLLGLDGLLLRRIVEAPVPRTSADLVLPLVLQRSEPLRIALVGSTPEVLAAVSRRIADDYGHEVVLACDGYAGLPDPAVLREQLIFARAQLVVVGLGAPRQDFYALALRAPGVLVATCGGWLDQFGGGEYYPSWAYPLRLNWLVRLAREPRRLWRRYSVEAIRAFVASRELTEYVRGRGAAALDATLGDTAPAADRRSAA